MLATIFIGIRQREDELGEGFQSSKQAERRIGAQFSDGIARHCECVSFILLSVWSCRLDCNRVNLGLVDEGDLQCLKDGRCLDTRSVSAQLRVRQLSLHVAQAAHRSGSARPTWRT